MSSFVRAARSGAPALLGQDLAGSTRRRMLRPGSFLWLVSYDLALTWRRVHGAFGGSGGRVSLWIAATVLAAFHAIAWLVAQWVATADPVEIERALAVAMLFVAPWLTAQSLTSATRALYTRGDFDLLFSSPLPASRTLAARTLAIAIETAGSVAIFVAPAANMNVLVNGWGWLALYPALAACALTAASLGVLLTLGLFALAGPRRTRILSQVLATTIGVAFVLTLQALYILPEAARDRLLAGAAGGWLPGRDGLLGTPVRAAGGAPCELLVWCAFAVIVFATTVSLLGRTFAAGAVQAANAPSRPVSVRRAAARMRFGVGSGWALRRKEWRLLARDPWLISQIMLQIVYTLPVSLIIWRSQGPDGSLALSVAPAIVVIASQVSASLTWLMISSEDAPDLIASAPVTRQDVERRKLQAVGLPLACFLATPVLGLALFEPRAAALAIVFASGAALSTALLNLWRPMPARRAMVLRRHSQSKLTAMIEHLLALLWAVAMVMAALGTALAAIPLALVGLLLWTNRPRRGALRAATAVAVTAPQAINES